MKKMKHSEENQRKPRINLVKLAQKNYQVDEDLPPFPEDEEEEEEENVNDPECLWRDGDQAPEEDPEEWGRREKVTKDGSA